MDAPLPGARRLANRYGGPALILIGGVAMLVSGWRRWADLLVDYGNQLYVPWRISEGEVLYRDLFYVFGPLSSYLHAGIFKLFGPGALYLILFNIALTALLTVLIFRLIAKLSGRWTATLAALMFLTVHALGQHKLLGNYNFIQPYSYDLTHGLFLSFLILIQLIRYMECPGAYRLCGIGLLLGLVFLTKIEVMLAAGVAVLTGFILAARVHRFSRRWIARSLLVGLLSFLTPPALFLLFLSLHMPIEDAFASLLKPWQLALAPQVHDFFYFRKMKGLAFLGHNLYQIGVYSLAFLGIVLALLALNRHLNRIGRNTFRTALLAATFLLALVLLAFWKIPWRFFLKPLPLLLLVLGGYLIYRMKHNFQPNRRFYQDAGLFVLTVFSLALMLKIFFRVVVFHYGFALSLPGALVAVVLIMHVIPRALQHRTQSFETYRVCASALILAYIFAMNVESVRFFSKKELPIGTGPDLMYDYHPMSRVQNGQPYIKGLIVKYVLEYIEKKIPPGAEVAVMPDAVMINYLSRHKDPIKGFLLNPVTWVLYGKDDYIVQQLEANPPPYFILVDRSYPEFDMTSFGKDYGRGIQSWLQTHYTLRKQFGATPFTLQGFGIQIYERASAKGAS